MSFLYCGIDGIRLLFVQYTVHWFSEIFATFTIVCTIRVFSVFTHIPYTVFVGCKRTKAEILSLLDKNTVTIYTTMCLLSLLYCYVNFQFLLIYRIPSLCV